MTTLYRLYNDTGDLLYVGIADNWPNRMKQHSTDKPWWPTVTQTLLEQHPTRQAAEIAERDAIRTGSPRYNIMHNTWHDRGKSYEVRGMAGPIKLGAVVALGLDNGTCPVGFVSDLTPQWVTLDLYSWLTGYFGFRRDTIAIDTIRRIANASKMTRSAAKQAGYGDTPDVWDMDSLADFQTRWTEQAVA